MAIDRLIYIIGMLLQFLLGASLKGHNIAIIFFLAFIGLNNLYDVRNTVASPILGNMAKFI